MEGFHVTFVREVEKYPELYNNTLKEYLIRDATENAWNCVAKEMKMTVNECKEKWRNLRSTFAKNLKPKPSGSGRSTKKPYYLTEAMKFAIPFIKVAGNSNGNLSENIVVTPEVDFSRDDETIKKEMTPEEEREDVATPEINSPEIGSPAPTQQDDATPGPSTSTRGPHGYPVRKRKLRQTQGDAEQAICEYLAAKRAKLALEGNSCREDGIRHFLMSLMPDLIQTNDMQLRKFKRKTLELIEEICGNSVEHFVPPQSYTSSAWSNSTMLAPDQLFEHPTEEG